MHRPGLWMQGRELSERHVHAVCAALPLPPGCASQLWGQAAHAGARDWLLESHAMLHRCAGSRIQKSRTGFAWGRFYPGPVVHPHEQVQRQGSSSWLQSVQRQLWMQADQDAAHGRPSLMQLAEMDPDAGSVSDAGGDAPGSGSHHGEQAERAPAEAPARGELESAGSVLALRQRLEAAGPLRVCARLSVRLCLCLPVRLSAHAHLCCLLHC